MNGLWIILGFLLTIGVVVAVHEGGHFGAARMLGIAVDRFSLGMGPVLWKRTKNGIEYVLSALPIGGYVRFVEDSPELTPEVRATLIKNAPIWKRAVVIAAGPLMNFILAVVLFAAVGLTGVRDIVPYVAAVDGTPAASAGVKPYDIITHVDGTKVNGIFDLNAELVAHLGEKNVTIGILRQGHPDERTLDLSGLSLDDVADTQGFALFQAGLRPIGRGTQIAEVFEGGAAQKAGFQKGDVIRRIDGVEVILPEVFDRIAASNGRMLAMEVERSTPGADGKSSGTTSVTLSVTPTKGDEGKWVIGVGLRAMPEFTTVTLNPIEAVKRGWDRVVQLTVIQTKSVAGMVTGKVSTENLSGPVGIANYAGDAVRAGLSATLEFIALISVAVGFMNLIPVPALDGGQLVLLVVEALRGKPLSDVWQGRIMQLSFGLLLALAVYVTVMDIGRL